MDAPTKRPLDETTATQHCVPCDKAGLQVHASGFCHDCNKHLCQACYDNHAKSSATEHHPLQDDNVIPRSGPAREKVLRRSAEPLVCSGHPDTSVEVFCMSHNIAVCGTCACDSHSPCCDTETISDMSRDFRTDNEYKGLTELFDSLGTKIDEVVAEVTSNTSLTKSEAKQEFLVQVNTKCEQFREKLNKQKSYLNKHEHNDSDLYVVSQKAKRSLRSIEMNLNHFLDQIQAFQSDTAKQNTEATSETDAMTEQDVDQGEKHGDDSQDREDAEALTQEQAKETQPDDNSNSKERLINRLDAAVLEKLYDLKWKIPYEFNSNWCMKGMTFVQPDQLFLVDYNNSQLKRINTTNNKVASVELNDRPYDVTALPYNRVVITLPWSNEIRFYDPKPKELEFAGFSKLHKMPLAISATRTMLVISYNYNPARLEVVDFTGKYQRTIAPDVDGKPLFINPSVVRVTKESHADVYVSDPDAKCVSRLAINGVVLFVYRDPMLSDPRGLAVTYGKQLLIASYRENCIHLVSHDGKKIRTLLGEVDGITRPLHVALSHAEHRVYISNDYGRGVLVYKIL